MTLRLTRMDGFATYQDLGRPGYAHLGISPSGAANRRALIRANHAVGNRSGAPALEIIGTCELEARAGALLALAGASAEVIGGRVGEGFGGTPVIAVERGQRVLITPRGLRTYIAARGGFEAPLTLGSASYDSLSGLGPRPLVASDRLAIGNEVGELRTIDQGAQASYAPGIPGPLLLASVYPGPRLDWVANADALFTSEYTVTAQSNRVGVRLQGPALVRSRGGELPSEGIVRGAIQIPPSGEPIIFGSDHPTTGGYPIVGVLAPAAVDALAHAAPGQVIRFRRALLRR